MPNKNIAIHAKAILLRVKAEYTVMESKIAKIPPLEYVMLSM
ncbi:MAG: hypothetical protein WCT05_15905 [Lentisphaeria bacterium]